MVKKHYWKLEYSITLFVVFGVILLIMPFSITNTRQANFISKWNETYNRVEYMFSVINAHISNDMLKSFSKAKTSKEKEDILIMIVKPYLRVNTVNYPIKHYKPRNIHGGKIYKGEDYFFNDFYFAENNMVIGLKNVESKYKEAIYFKMMFDINGILPPNRWGKDIYGVNIFDEGRIEPFGYDMNMDNLRNDCSDSGTGVACSYYYKIGGGFDD